MSVFDEHIREQDSRECRACGKTWPCPSVDTMTGFRVAATVMSQDRHSPIDDWTDDELAAATAVVEKRREERRRLDVYLDRQRRRDAQHRGVLEGTTWRTADGRTLDVSEMTPDHALKTLTMLEWGRHATGWWAIQQAENVEGHVSYGYTCDFARFGRWPLTDTLWKRSQESPSLLERLRDFRSYRSYKRRS